MSNDAQILPFRRPTARTQSAVGNRAATGEGGNGGFVIASVLSVIFLVLLLVTPWGSVINRLPLPHFGKDERLLIDRTSLAEGPNGALVHVKPYVAEEDCVLVATSTRQQQQGLKEQLNPGLLAFSWHHPTRASFTMQDTPSNLTLVWVANGRVVAAEPMASETTTVHTAPVPVTLAVEYPAPAPGESGPNVGDQLSLGGYC